MYVCAKASWCSTKKMGVTPKRTFGSAESMITGHI